VATQPIIQGRGQERPSRNNSHIGPVTAPCKKEKKKKEPQLSNKGTFLRHVRKKRKRKISLSVATVDLNQRPKLGIFG